MSIAIRRVIVPETSRIIAQGQTVAIGIEVAEIGFTNRLIDPTNIPLISIFDPNGVALVTDTPMVYSSLGRYIYSFITTTSYPIGTYTCTITVVNNTEMARIEKLVVFTTKTATTLVTFTYLAIKDQNNVIWYWYIAADNTLTSISTIPSVLGKQASVIVIAVTPSWLEINNPTPALRYVYPGIDGTVTVSASQPAVGSGNVGSPVIVSVNAASFKVSLNASDEVILSTV